MHMAHRDHQGDQDEDVHDNVPLHKKQSFSAGLHRRKVNFVPASDSVLKTTSNTDSSASSTSTRSASDFYLNLVLPKEAIPSLEENGEEPKKEDVERCDICNLPIPISSSSSSSSLKNNILKAHETSIAHQFCLTHSHPPSALDRSRMGLAVLESQGWDPDARQGLGAEGQGIKDPIKPVPKSDNLGLGMRELLLKGATPPVKVEKKKKPLDAKQARKKADEEKRKHDALMRQFYGNPDVERYLGGG